MKITRNKPHGILLTKDLFDHNNVDLPAAGWRVFSHSLLGDTFFVCLITLPVNLKNPDLWKKGIQSTLARKSIGYNLPPKMLSKSLQMSL